MVTTPEATLAKYHNGYPPKSLPKNDRRMSASSASSCEAVKSYNSNTSDANQQAYISVNTTRLLSAPLLKVELLVV